MAPIKQNELSKFRVTHEEALVIERGERCDGGGKSAGVIGEELVMTRDVSPLHINIQYVLLSAHSNVTFHTCTVALCHVSILPC